MFNLYQMITSAHDGQGLGSLAQQFGISHEQADSAVQSLVPALSTAFMTKAAMPGGLNDIAGAMTDDQHRQAYADPDAAQDPATQEKGGDVVGNIFGNNAIVGQVVQQASSYTGIDASTLNAMLPTITSMVVGGAAMAMHNQGMGGMIGQLANGGLGNILSQFGGAGAATGTGGIGSGAGQEGGVPGMLGNIFNSFFGGGQTTPQPTQAPGATPQDGDPTGTLPPVMQAGMDQLFKMFQPGVAGQGAQPGNLADMISASLNQRR